MPIPRMDTLMHKVSLGWWGALQVSARSLASHPLPLLLLTFLPPAEQIAAEGHQACGQEEGQQHQARGQDADLWDGDPVGEMEGAQQVSPESCSMLCTWHSSSASHPCPLSFPKRSEGTGDYSTWSVPLGGTPAPTTNPRKRSQLV